MLMSPHEREAAGRALCHKYGVDPDQDVCDPGPYPDFRTPVPPPQQKDWGWMGPNEVRYPTLGMYMYPRVVPRWELAAREVERLETIFGVIRALGLITDSTTA